MAETSTQSILLAGAAVSAPCHACAFFDSKEQEYDVLLPFIEQGFARGDKSFHIINESHREKLHDRLASRGVDTTATQHSGQLEIRGWENSHLRPGWFDQEAMLALVEHVLTTAKDQGYGHTRWVADMGWALEDKPGVENLVEYCVRMNRVVPKYNATVICTYDLARFSAGQVVEVLRSHPLAVIGGIVQENPFYVSPEQFLQQMKPPVGKKARG